MLKPQIKIVKTTTIRQVRPFEMRQAIKPVGANQASIQTKKLKYALTSTDTGAYSSTVQECIYVQAAEETPLTASVPDTGFVQKKSKKVALPGISSSKNYWFSNLASHTDNDIVQKILTCIENGFPVGITQDIPVIQSQNWPSSDKFRTQIKQFLEERLLEGSVERVSTEELECHSISPIGAFEKGAERKLRVIHDLSYPPELSVNSYLNKQDYSVKYYTVRDAVDICQSMDTPWLAKTDLKNAYFSCPVAEKDKKLLGFSFKMTLVVQNTSAGRRCLTGYVQLHTGLI